jgi:dihydropyrimidinase
MEKEIDDLAIIGGLVVNSQQTSRQDIYIKNGLIKEISTDSTINHSVKQTIDASGKYVLPGFIDAHLHPVYADHMDTISKAAACEGITTLIPYIGAVKAWGQEKNLTDTIDDFIQESNASSVVDYSIHCTILQDDIKDSNETIPKLIEKGIISFKAFMAYSKRGMMLDDTDLIQLMNIIGTNGGILAAHAENGAIIDYLEAFFTAKNQETPEYMAKSHPNLSEAEAIFRLLTLGSTTGCPIYIPHISASESLEVVRLFKKWGQPKFYTETCPHYLVFTDEEFNKKGTLAKMSPPLRKQNDIDALWQAIKNNEIDVIASDAAGHKKQANEPHYEQCFQAPNGIPGMESLVKTIYELGVNKGRMTTNKLVKLLCENPARIFGLYPQKGVLKEGSDADVVIFDPSLPYVIPPKNRFMNVDYSLYENHSGIGAPVTTLLRGEIIMADQHLTGTPGQGKFVSANRMV